MKIERFRYIKPELYKKECEKFMNTLSPACQDIIRATFNDLAVGTHPDKDNTITSLCRDLGFVDNETGDVIVQMEITGIVANWFFLLEKEQVIRQLASWQEQQWI
eukprot:TRINITY_DN5075_c0_g1_i1.p1 TRINITY_DN5075_c0_g1~~TRINITY_DN5075_c0_g1_i1.p1  ORF type:complete len:105 (+),score=16.46 TRINITY_DN5075_c0_g1_i1:189-503(+)